MSLEVGIKFCGLVDATGAGGCSIASSDNWVLVLHLAAYRSQGPVVNNGLRCEWLLSADDLNHWMSQIEPYSIVEATISGFTDGGAAVLSRLQLVESRDVELETIKEMLLEPVILRTRRFGPLLLDRGVGTYEGKVQWCGAAIDLSISCEDYRHPDGAVEIAEALFEAQQEWSHAVKEFAADRLLNLKNENWLGEYEADLSRNDFISRMKIQSINIDAGGDLTFCHDDGDLFWGHTIQISGSLEGGLSNADIPG